MSDARTRGTRPRIDRRLLLLASVLLSLVAHALLVAYSDRVTLIAPRAAPPRSWMVFRVDLKEDAPAPEPAASATDSGVQPGSPTRPASLEDLLRRETERLEPAEPFLTAKVDVPQLAERLSHEPLEREHNLELDADTLERIDAKVVEISASEARQDIEVPRRLARPSAPRVLAENETPTLGGEASYAEIAASLPPGASTFSSEPVGPPAPVTEVQALRAAAAPDVPTAPMVEPERGLPELPVEEAVARAPLTEDLRAENPYEFIDDLVDIHVESYIPPGNGQGYFRLRIAPKKDGAVQILPKDVTFVVDASSSIAQRKLDEVVAGVKRSIELLRPDDRFNVIVFRDSPKQFQPEHVNATQENKAAAMQFLSGLESFGQTDVFAAVRPVLEVPTREGIPGMTFVITDGRPTTGLRDGRLIINNLTEENRERKPIYAYSGGKTVNRYLLDLLAYRNKGESFVSEEIDAMDKDLPAFFLQLNDPLLTDLRADYGSIAEENVFPKELPDFFRGRAVTVYGRFDPKKEGELVMRLVGRAGAAQKELVFKADLAEARTGDAEIARNWAFRKVYHLIGEMVRAGETPELIAQLRDLCRQYNIRTVYDE